MQAAEAETDGGPRELAVARRLSRSPGGDDPGCGPRALQDGAGQADGRLAHRLWCAACWQRGATAASRQGSANDQVYTGPSGSQRTHLEGGKAGGRKAIRKWLKEPKRQAGDAAKNYDVTRAVSLPRPAQPTRRQGTCRSGAQREARAGVPSLSVGGCRVKPGEASGQSRGRAGRCTGPWGHSRSASS